MDAKLLDIRRLVSANSAAAALRVKFSLLALVIGLMTGSQDLLAQQRPLFAERFANVFDPSSRTYFSLQGTQGDIGGQQPFTSFGAMHFAGDIHDAITLYSGNIMVQNSANPSGTFGAQQRWMTVLPILDTSILGAGLYMDFTQSRYDNIFQQLNLNMELLTESSWLGRFNGYFPVGRIEAGTGLEQNFSAPPGQLDLVGTTIGYSGINRALMDVGLMGTDFEFGRKFFNYRMEAYAGYYNWSGPLAGFTNGIKGGVRGYLTNNLSGNVNITHDGFFGTNVYGGLTYYFGGRGGNRPMTFRNLMTLPAQRQQQVTIGNFTREQSNFVAAHDAATNDELHLYFVEEGGTGAGTQSSPSSVNSVLADTHFATGSTMVLVDSNGNITSPIALNHDRQQIIGGGDSGTATVDFSLALGQAPGTSVITFSNLGGRPVLIPPAGDAVTLTNQNTIQGFTIDGNGGLTNGVVGAPGASNTVVNDLVIRNVAGTGIKIQPSTNTTINSTTFQNNGLDILLNAASSQLTDITSTGAINGGLNLGGSGGDITGNTLISDVTFTGAGGFGGILLNNAQNGSVTQLTNVNISNGTGAGVTVTNSQAGALYNLTNVDVLNVGSNGVLLQNSNGTINVDATSSITNTSAAAFAINEGTIDATFSGAVSQANAASAVDVSGNHTGMLNFTTGSSITTTNGNGVQFNAANGAYNFHGTTLMNGGDAGIDILNSTGTFVFTNPLISNMGGGIGVNVSGAAKTTFNGLDITTSANTGFKVVSGGLTTVNGTANIDAASQAAIDISDTPLAATFTNVTSTGSATDGMTLNNVSGLFGVTGITTVFNAAGRGISIANSSSLTSTLPNVAIDTTGGDGVNLADAGVVSIAGGTINGTAGDGIHSSDTNLTAIGLNLGGTGTITGDGIEVVNNGAAHVVNLSNNTIKANANGLSTLDSGNAGELLLTLDGNTLQSTNVGSRALYVSGNGADSTIIQSMNGGTILGGAGGGSQFDRVTFDASGVALSGAQVYGGNWTIGTTSSPVQGDGLRFDSPAGDVKFETLNIVNTNGTALEVNATSSGPSFRFGNNRGIIDNTNGAAIIVGGTSLASTFNSLTSIGSVVSGVHITNSTGGLSLNGGLITDGTPRFAAIEVDNSSLANVSTFTLNLNSMTIKGSLGSPGILVTGESAAAPILLNLTSTNVTGGGGSLFATGSGAGIQPTNATITLDANSVASGGSVAPSLYAGGGAGIGGSGGNSFFSIDIGNGVTIINDGTIIGAAGNNGGGGAGVGGGGGYDVGSGGDGSDVVVSGSGTIYGGNSGFSDAAFSQGGAGAGIGGGGGGIAGPGGNGTGAVYTGSGTVYGGNINLVVGLSSGGAGAGIGGGGGGFDKSGGDGSHTSNSGSGIVYGGNANSLRSYQGGGGAGVGGGGGSFIGAGGAGVGATNTGTAFGGAGGREGGGGAGVGGGGGGGRVNISGSGGDGSQARNAGIAIGGAGGSYLSFGIRYGSGGGAGVGGGGGGYRNGAGGAGTGTSNTGTATGGPGGNGDPGRIGGGGAGVGGGGGSLPDGIGGTGSGATNSGTATGGGNGSDDVGNGGP